MSFLSQLDLVRAFPRIFRRAGIALAYSKGMRPKPLVSFSPALPLGATAVRDLADVRLAEPDLEGQVIAQRLQAAAPGGFEILSVRPLGPWEKKLSRRVAAVDSVIVLGRPAARNAELEERIERFLDADTVEVQAETKNGGNRRVNLRTQVFEARVVERSDPIPSVKGPFLFIRTQPTARLLLVSGHLLGAKVPGTSLYRINLLARGPLGFAPIR